MSEFRHWAKYAYAMGQKTSIVVTNSCSIRLDTICIPDVQKFKKMVMEPKNTINVTINN